MWNIKSSIIVSKTTIVFYFPNIVLSKTYGLELIPIFCRSFFSCWFMYLYWKALERSMFTGNIPLSYNFFFFTVAHIWHTNFVSQNDHKCRRTYPPQSNISPMIHPVCKVRQWLKINAIKTVQPDLQLSFGSHFQTSITFYFFLQSM